MRIEKKRAAKDVAPVESAYVRATFVEPSNYTNCHETTTISCCILLYYEAPSLSLGDFASSIAIDESNTAAIFMKSIRWPSNTGSFAEF